MSQIDSQLINLIMDPQAWKLTEILMKATLPAMIILRYCDKKSPVMDSLHFYVRRMTQSIEKMRDTLNQLDTRTFEKAVGDLIASNRGRTARESDDDGNSDDESSDTESDESTDIDLDDLNVQKTDRLGNWLIKYWNKRCLDLRSGYAITAWYLNPMQEVMEDLKKTVPFRTV